MMLDYCLFFLRVGKCVFVCVCLSDYMFYIVSVRKFGEMGRIIRCVGLGIEFVLVGGQIENKCIWRVVLYFRLDKY